MLSFCRNLRCSHHRGSVARRVTGKRNIVSSPARLSIEKLQASFRDPSSPFYLAPGTEGPSHPGEGFVVPEQVHQLHGVREEHAAAGQQEDTLGSESTRTPEDEAKAKLTDMGYDALSFYEQKVVWGDLDSFRHVNNVRYLRFLESARIHWMQTLALELGGPQRATNMVSGKGVSLILKDITLRFRRPVLYPDTLLIAHRPHTPHPTHFGCAAAIWSYAQRAIVTTSDSTLTWYDYDHLKKCDPGPEAHAVLAKRIRT